MSEKIQDFKDVKDFFDESKIDKKHPLIIKKKGRK